MPSKAAYYAQTRIWKPIPEGSIEDWLKEQDFDITQADVYVDLEQSGADSTRE